jgi:hypothetical protein
MVDQRIKKDDRFLCTTTVVMDEGDTAYLKGETYISERNGCITNRWGQKDHEWRVDEGEDQWWDYFTKTPHPVETCECDKCIKAAILNDRDYFQTVQEEYGKSEDKFDGTVKIMETFSNLSNLLVYKNTLYGNSGLQPINVFSKANAETGLLQRLDDKIARVQNSPELRKNDVADIIGYLVLICVSKGWTNFDEFKD